MNNINTNNLYKTINELCDSKRDWEEESISFSRIDKLINDNLDHFFSPSEEYGMKAKFESLLNLSERVKKEFNNDLGKILAFSIQGIANEVLNEGVHIEPSLPPEIIEQIIFYMLLVDFKKLEDIYPKNSDLIWRKFKLNVDNVVLKILEVSNDNLRFFGIYKSLDAVDFYVDRKHQLSKINLQRFGIDKELLAKLSNHYPHLQILKLQLRENIGQEGVNYIGNMTSLKILHINTYYPVTNVDLSLVLEKLSLLTELNLYNNACQMQKINYIENMTNLRALELSSKENIPTLSLSLEKMTSLTSLKLRHNPFLAVDISVIGRMIDLKSLYLESENIPGKNLSIVLDKLSSLTDLSLIDEACKEPEVINAIEKMTSLTHLDLTNTNSIPEMNLITTLKKMTSLKTLHLIGTTVSLENLPSAIEKMMALCALSISSYNYNDKDKINILINVLKKFPNLQLIYTSKDMIDALQPELKHINFFKSYN